MPNMGGHYNFPKSVGIGVYGKTQNTKGVIIIFQSNIYVYLCGFEHELCRVIEKGQGAFS